MRTTEGPKRVDVLYRRLDDDFLDPLTFRPDSVLGVPGLMNAYRAGNITLANAVGTGVADDKAVYSYMPEIVRFYLGEEPILKNVPTWRCREPDALRLCARPSRRAGGEGGRRLRRLRHADRPGRRPQDARSASPHKLKANPANFIAQPTLALSTSPTFVGAGIAPRHVDLRPFVLCRRRQDPHRPRRPHPRRAEGRLAGRQFEPGRRHQGHLGARRMSADDEPRRVNLPLEGRSKFAREARISGGGIGDCAALPPSRNRWRRFRPPLKGEVGVAPSVRRVAMLSRTADSLFWLSRYVERADNTARIIDAASRLDGACRSPMPAPRTNGSRRSPPPARSAPSTRARRTPTATPSSISSPSPPTTRRASRTASRPRAHNGRADAHRADRRDVGGDQRRLARAEALRRRQDGPRRR